MSEEIKPQIKPNEIQFVQLMEAAIIPNRKNVDIGTLAMVGSLVNIPINQSCRSCAAKGGTDMLNLYNQLKPKYDLYMFETMVVKEPELTKLDDMFEEEIKKTWEPEVFTKYEMSEIPEPVPTKKKTTK